MEFCKKPTFLDWYFKKSNSDHWHIKGFIIGRNGIMPCYGATSSRVLSIRQDGDYFVCKTNNTEYYLKCDLYSKEDLQNSIEVLKSFGITWEGAELYQYKTKENQLVCLMADGMLYKAIFNSKFIDFSPHIGMFQDSMIIMDYVAGIDVCYYYHSDSFVPQDIDTYCVEGIDSLAVYNIGTSEFKFNGVLCSSDSITDINFKENKGEILF